MPAAEPAGVRCIQLSTDNYCLIFGKPERPDVCGRFTACPDVCGTNQEEAITLITELEHHTNTNS
ncbi:hypothetical protein A9Q81_08010 [Gammaproteobacteria bacterium 42_54_T18]|nr:hypothetical protein A9Q81_08010 [Gammaproteobacteria bacterium 42_54_T18]